jgi:2-polyprenyl-6-methoxyphenol hydroxylase-like FAD-dependent oxidoreductase
MIESGWGAPDSIGSSSIRAKFCAGIGFTLSLVDKYLAQGGFVAKNPSVLISGIGIAGPTLAYWLEENRFKATLVERAASPREGGYVIDFWGVGYDIAERMGILPDLKALGYDVGEVRFVDRNGRRVGGFDAKVFKSLTNGRYLSLPRGDLASLLYREIEGRCETIFADTIAEVEQDELGVNVTFEHSKPRRFDLLIGAGGLHSVVRKLVFGPEEHFRRFLGYVAAAFEVKGYEPRDEGIYVTYATPGKQVARFAMRDDRTVFLLVFSTDQPLQAESFAGASHKKVLHQQFDREGWECPRILAALDTCDELYLDEVTQIHMNTWSQGRVALVGDAAFCPSLLAGEGSALAMMAAYVLAGELSKRKDNPEAAFEHYARFLRYFILEKQAAAEQLASSFIPQTRFDLFVRNQITKAFSIPFVARLAMGRMVVDRIGLPIYSVCN